MNPFSRLMLSSALLLGASAPVFASQGTLILRFTTGGDDLRGGNVSGSGNNLHLHFLTDSGTRVLRRVNANNYATWGGGSVNEVAIADVGAIGNLASLVISESDRVKADIFEEVDHWNLDALQVVYRVDGSERVLLDVRGAPLHRFTAGGPERTFPLTRVIDRCASDSACDDGQFCNGVETCHVVTDRGPGVLRECVAGAPPACSGGEVCDESADRCLVARGSADVDGDGADSAAMGGNDCDDNDRNRYPGNIEICDADGRDEDCDLTTGGDLDADGDGHNSSACFNWGAP